MNVQPHIHTDSQIRTTMCTYHTDTRAPYRHIKARKSNAENFKQHSFKWRNSHRNNLSEKRHIRNCTHPSNWSTLSKRPALVDCLRSEEVSLPWTKDQWLFFIHDRENKDEPQRAMRNRKRNPTSYMQLFGCWLRPRRQNWRRKEICKLKKKNLRSESVRYMYCICGRHVWSSCQIHAWVSACSIDLTR